MNRAERRRQERAIRLVGPDGKTHKLRKAKTGVFAAPVPDQPGPPVTEQVIREAKERMEQRPDTIFDELAQSEAMERLRESIPPRLRDTPEAQLLLTRVASTWVAPTNPSQVRAWQQEWADFLATQPESRLEHAAKAGLWVPKP